MPFFLSDICPQFKQIYFYQVYMNSTKVRQACKPIEDLIEGITIPLVSNAKALSDSPIYCIRTAKRIHINKEKVAEINLEEKPELLMFLVLHEVQHINDNSLMADLRFDRQALEEMIKRGIDISKINPDDFASLLNDSDSFRLDRINQLIKFQTTVQNV